MTYPANTDSGISDPIAGDQLKSIVERIERLEEEKKGSPSSGVGILPERLSPQITLKG